jgi:hypothetical protein
MSEMRILIGKRLESEGTPRHRSGSGPIPPATDADGTARTLQAVVSEVDQYLTRAASNHETMRDDLKFFASEFKDVGELTHLGFAPAHLHGMQKTSDLDKTRVELQNSRRQCDLVKSLLADATAEKEIMYEVWTIQPWADIYL